MQTLASNLTRESGSSYDNETLKKNIRRIILDLRQMKSFCAEPRIIRSAEGIYLTDIDGKRYIDGVSGIYVVNIGHGNARVIEAIRKQQERVSFVAPLHAVSDTAVEYAARLGEVTPEGLQTIKLLSGGSEATETALKFTRQYHRQMGQPSKYKFISLYKGYHGGTMGSISATGLGGPRKNVFGPFLEGFVRIPPPDGFRAPPELKSPAYELFCAKMLETTILGEGADSVAGFIIEPISNTGGIVVPPPDYFKLIREICTRHNVLLIFDEVITGFGRTGEWFASQTFDCAPDLLCMGKGMGSGYAPLAGVAFRDDLYFDGFWGEDHENVHFAHGHTFGANPISAAAGLAALQVIEENDLIANGRVIGDYLRRRVAEEVGKLGILGEVRGKGCLMAVEFVRDPKTLESFPVERHFGKKVERRLLEKGLILRCDPNWIALAPPLITTLEQAAGIVDIFIEAVREELENSS
jgi:adenosylmethionine-8-amino-7-oxononanoate aminotransferase